MVKIIRINAFIQRKMGKVLLDGKEVSSVALDGSCNFENYSEPEVMLDKQQLDTLFAQTFGFTQE
jgi:hypothetical protein